MCGGASVSWFSRTQKCMTLSTTEAEYVALADIIKEVLFLRQVWRFMLPQVRMPCIPVFEDNEGAVQLAQNPITNSNSRSTSTYGTTFLENWQGGKKSLSRMCRPVSSMQIS